PRYNHLHFFLLLRPPPPTSPLFPYTTLFRSFLPSTCGVTGVASAPVTPITLENADGAQSEADDRQRDQHPDCREMESPHEPVSRSEEHTSELQSRGHLVCRLLLEKKKKKNIT